MSCPLSAAAMGAKCSSCQKACRQPDAVQFTVTIKSDAEFFIKEGPIDLAIIGSSFMEVGDWLRELARDEMMSSDWERYNAVLQKVLDLLVNALGAQSQAAAFVVVVPDTAMKSLDMTGQSLGCLFNPGQPLTVHDADFREVFTEAVERLTHCSNADTCPIGGGFAVNSTNGAVLAQSVTFVRGANAIGSGELAHSLDQGVIFTRSMDDGVMVFPAKEVKRGRAWTVDLADVRWEGAGGGAVGVGLFGSLGQRTLAPATPVQTVRFAGAWCTEESADPSQGHAALRMHEAALREALRNNCPDEMSIGASTESCGLAHRRLSNWRQAVAHHERTLEICVANSAATTLTAAQAWSNLGLAQLETNPSQAQKSFARALELFEVRCGTRSLHASREACHAGVVMQLVGNPAKAAQHYQAAYDMAQKWLQPTDLQMSVLKDNLGIVFRELGELQRSKQLHEEALAIAETMLGQFDAQLARSLTGLAMVEQELGMAARARALLERALLLTQTFWGKGHNFSLTVLLDMVSCFSLLGMAEQARTCLDQYTAALPALPVMPSIGTRLQLKAAAMGFAASIPSIGGAAEKAAAESAANALWDEAVRQMEEYLGSAATCRVCALTITSLRRSWSWANQPLMLEWLSERAHPRSDLEGLRFSPTTCNAGCQGDKVPQSMGDDDADSRPVLVEEITSL